VRAFLVTWNPRKWDWQELAHQVLALQRGEVVEDRWSCGNRRDISPGDRLFLLRQAVEPRGLMASGWATSSVFRAAHWDKTRAASGEMANYVRLRFDRLLDPEAGLLRLESLRSGPTADVNWSTQSSGILLPPDAARHVEAASAGHVGSTAELDEEIAALEGAQRHRLVVHRHREQVPRARKLEQALTANGGRLVCEVPGCGFDFFAVYGELGRRYAHVHHLLPLGSRERPSRTVLSHLAIVCANCHAMIHRGGKCRSLKNLMPERAHAG
jgi:5-methylcytosine-specific restriction protein A